MRMSETYCGSTISTTRVSSPNVLNDKYSVLTGLYLEERSYSGGNNTLDNLVVYPRIVLQVEDDLTKNGNIGYWVKGGDLWNEDVGDILRLYNIDYQGIIAKVRFKNTHFGFMTIGDLSRNIGLDLHQLYKFTTEYRTDSYRQEISFTINELFTQPFNSHPSATDFNVANYSRFKLNSTSYLEAQLDVRINPNIDPSLAAGIRYKYQENDLSLTSSLRYYADGFNLGYSGRGPRYAGPGGSYLGEQLYPLRNFYRDMSQWALYTHSVRGDLWTFEVSGKWNKRIYKKLSLNCILDINYLHDVEDNSGQIFPIYDIGAQVDFLRVFKGGISVTNRHMELRNFYQTLAVSRAPFLSLSFRVVVDQIKLGTKYID